MKLVLHPRAPETLADQLFAAGVEFPCGGESVCGACKMGGGRRVCDLTGLMPSAGLCRVLRVNGNGAGTEILGYSA